MGLHYFVLDHKSYAGKVLRSEREQHFGKYFVMVYIQREI